jgi:SSS family solute:Na+ symporter
MTGFALVGSTGKAYTSGVGVYGLMASWSGLIHSAVFFVIGIKLWAVGKRHGYVTQCEYFRERFESPSLGYLLFPVLVFLVIPYLLVGVISSGKFIQGTTAGMFPDLFPLLRPDGTAAPLHGSVPVWAGSLVICVVVLFYVFFGGLRGAVWANTMQTLVFMITGVIAFYLISKKLGGLVETGRLVTDSEFARPRLAREGMMGQLQFFSYCFIPLSVGMFPHLFQHWLTARSAKSFRLSLIAHPICIMIVWLPCILIGIWAAGHFGAQFAARPNVVLGQVVRVLVESEFLTGLVAAGVLAAIMSSLDSQFMCLGTMFTNDVVMRKFGRNRFTDAQKIFLARCFIVGIVAVTFLLALWLQDSAHVFDLGVWCFTGFASLFPLAFAAVYWRRTTAAGAVASLSTKGVTWLVLFYRDIIATKPPGEDELLIWDMMPVAPIFLASVAALVIVSLLTRPPRDSTLDKFFPRKLLDT